MDMQQVRDLIAEMADSLIELRDVTKGLKGPGKGPVLNGLTLLEKQVTQLAELTKDD